jgi:hypothetical protein
MDANGMQAHHLVVYMRAQVDPNSMLKLQASETDAAVWLPIAQLSSILPPHTGPDASATTTISVLTDSGGLDQAVLLLSELAGIYPNDTNAGIAQGHLFALSQLLASPSGCV